MRTDDPASQPYLESPTDGNQEIEKEQIMGLMATCVPANILNGTCINYSACFQVQGSTEAIIFDVDNESGSHFHGRTQKGRENYRWLLGRFPTTSFCRKIGWMHQSVVGACGKFGMSELGNVENVAS